MPGKKIRRNRRKRKAPLPKRQGGRTPVLYLLLTPMKPDTKEKKEKGTGPGSSCALSLLARRKRRKEKGLPDKEEGDKEKKFGLGILR